MKDTTYSSIAWLPCHVQNYLEHTVSRVPLRALARARGLHPSTVLRQVRRVETLRDDPLVDAVLQKLERKVELQRLERKGNGMELAEDEVKLPDDAVISREAVRILTRLCEDGAVLAVAAGMEKAVVVREAPDGAQTRTAVVESEIVQVMAVREWISSRAQGRVSRYAITAAGRAALNRLLAEAENRAQGFCEVQGDFEHQAGTVGGGVQIRSGMLESPLIALARRRDRNGQLFLNSELVSAGERLREDFEISQMARECRRNWEEFLSGADRSLETGEDHKGTGACAARNRLLLALAELGDGLADVALRCCCMLEGLETAEKRLGWSARSGKIVLRIALIRLREHYRRQGGLAAGLIG